MGKFNGILICTDLDGTLYRNDKTISLENTEAIEYFKREGGYFTFITGRMPYYSLPAYQAVGPNVPFGCINGGGVYDGETGEYVFTRPMPEGFTGLIEAVEKAVPNVGIQVCLFDNTYFAKENEVMVEFRRITGIPNLTCDYRTASGPIAKILFGVEREEEIQAIERTLGAHPLSDRFHFIRSEKHLYEILPKGVNKGLALEKLIEYLKIDPKKSIAIGDYNNDIGMFRAAGLGVAVSNACKEALKAADRITVSNEEHAIARVISDLESGAIVL